MLAPVTAVRGNNDHGPWADEIAETELLAVGGTCIYVIHDINKLEIDPKAGGVRVIVAGHSHHPAMSEREGVLFVNPESAGPQRFRLPVAIGELRIDGHNIVVHTVALLAPVQH